MASYNSIIGDFVLTLDSSTLGQGLDVPGNFGFSNTESTAGQGDDEPSAQGPWAWLLNLFHDLSAQGVSSWLVSLFDNDGDSSSQGGSSANGPLTWLVDLFDGVSAGFSREGLFDVEVDVDPLEAELEVSALDGVFGAQLGVSVNEGVLDGAVEITYLGNVVNETVSFDLYG